MFDNILGHKALVAELTHDVENDILPASLLFHGPELSGKLTTALELARVLMCLKRTAVWNCDCRSCEQNRMLENPYLLLLGFRNFVDEIRAAADVVLRSDAPSARLLLIRAVRKLEKGFDGTLWEGAEKRIAPLLGTLEELEEALRSLQPGAPGQTPAELEKCLDRITDLSASISKKIGTDAIPVHQVRKASYWAHTTAGESPKVVVLDGVDRMLPGARNALLKTLEEPPADTYFILLTSRKEGVIPTLKSRLRQFQFYERTREIEGEILRRLYRKTSGEYGSLKEFFLAWSTSPDVVKTACDRLFTSLTTEDADYFFMEDNGEASYLADLKDHRIFKAFLGELSACGREGYLTLVDGGAPAHRDLIRYEAWNKTLSKQLQRLESLNMNPGLLLESLYKEMASVS
jgi:DNA polymerase III subunit gamma/tau